MFTSIEEIKRANQKAGQHFFDKSTMEFFGSKVLEVVWENGFFVTSEKQPDSVFPRRYTVRQALPNGHIRKASRFQQYETAAEATAAIRKHLKDGTAF